MAIGVNGNSNQIDLQKLLKTMQGQKAGSTRAAKKAPGMSMNESIFDKNAQMISGENKNVSQTRRTNVTQNVATVNTAKSVDGIKKAEKTEDTKGTETTKSETGNIKGDGERKPKINISDIDFGNLGSVSTEDLKSVKQDLKNLLDGDAPFFLRVPFEQKLDKVNAEIQNRNEQDGNKLSDDNKKAEEKQKEANDMKADAQSGASEANSGSRTSEKNTAKMKNISSETQSLEKEIQKEEKNLIKEQKATNVLVNKNIKAIDKENKNIESLNAENETINSQIEDANAKIKELSQNGTEDSQGEIDALSSNIEQMTNKNTVNIAKIGKSDIAIKKYTISNNVKIRRLQKNAKVYTRTMNTNQKQIQSNQQESNKTLETATKIEQTSQKIATVGSITKYTGMAMMAWAFTHAAGVALKTVGTVTETAGNYGIMAANITKAAVYVADGNLTGALMSAGSAIMSGATAIGNTKQLANAAKGASAASTASKKAAEAAEEAKKAAEEAAKEAAGNTGKDAAKDVAKDTAKDVAKDTAKDVAKAPTGVSLEGMPKSLGVSNNIPKVSAESLNKLGKQINVMNLNSQASNLTKLSQDLAKNSGFKGFMNNVANSSSEKFISKTATQLGGAMQMAASQFGFMQQTPTAAATAPRRGTALPQYSTRRKIA